VREEEGALGAFIKSLKTAFIKKKKEKVLSNTFEHNGLRYGIEVCNDHNGRLLKQTSEEKVDVHIIVSCGVTIEQDKIHARDGGVVLHTDGEIATKNKMKKTLARSMALRALKVINLEQKLFSEPDNGDVDKDKMVWVEDLPKADDRGDFGWVYTGVVQLN
jgi:hypothetical protein